MLETIVAVAKSIRSDYGNLPSAMGAPELPTGQVTTVAGLAIRELFRSWDLDKARYGTRDWNPLGTFVSPGDRVVVKPNWVHHANKSGEGLECLLTDTTILEAVLEYVGLARPRSVVVGDAPIQGCDFNRLRIDMGLDEMAERLGRHGISVLIADFRRTLLPEDRIGTARVENARPAADYVLVDLGRDSLLEALAADEQKFRVTMYNPDLLVQAHSQGRHQYLIAREVLRANVVINLPKLKSHKKAGITGALKNLVGINGNKEFLPHHRKGGSSGDGDCYIGSSWLKHQAEELLDSANRSSGTWGPVLKGRLADIALRGAAKLGHDTNLEGSWYGNDTVWRTCLDLQRILRYATEGGTLEARPQRLVISITDAIIAGQKEGPLAPSPMPAGFVTGAVNPAAAEWIHARLMGFSPLKVPLVCHAFDPFRFPLCDFRPEAIRIRVDGGDVEQTNLPASLSCEFQPASGWKGHVESDER